MSNFQDRLASVAKAGKDAALVATKQAELKKIQTVDLSKAFVQLGKSVYSQGSEREKFPKLHSQVGELQVKIKDLKSQIDNQPEAEKLTDKAKQIAIATKQKAEIKALQLQTNRLLLELGKELFRLYGNETKPVELADSIRDSKKRIELLSKEIHELEESSKGKFLTPKRIIVGVACVAGFLLFASVLSLFSESQNNGKRNSLSSLNAEARKLVEASDFAYMLEVQGATLETARIDSLEDPVLVGDIQRKLLLRQGEKGFLYREKTAGSGDFVPSLDYGQLFIRSEFSVRGKDKNIFTPLSFYGDRFEKFPGSFNQFEIVISLMDNPEKDEFDCHIRRISVLTVTPGPGQAHRDPPIEFFFGGKASRLK